MIAYESKLISDLRKNYYQMVHPDREDRVIAPPSSALSDEWDWSEIHAVGGNDTIVHEPGPEI